MFKIEFVGHDDIKKLADFLASCNQQSEHHIGYCGTEAEEIEQTLLNEFSDLPLEKCFLIAKDREKIIAAIGLDVDKENNSAEVWGPFLLVEKHSDILLTLWNRLVDIHMLDQYLFFINQNNALALDISRKIGALNKGEHYQLSISAREIERAETEEIVPFHPRYFNDFVAIHSQEFPDTYFNSNEIMNRLNKDHQLFVYIQDNKLMGYVYAEASEEFSEGSIEYIAVHPDYRNNGIGRKLLNHGLQFLFSYEGIEQVFLTVNHKEQGALRLYQSVGFQKKSSLLFFKWTP